MRKIFVIFFLLFYMPVCSDTQHQNLEIITNTNYINCFYKYHHTILMGTNGGLVDITNNKKYTFIDGLISNIITVVDIYQEKLAVGTRAGLSIMENNEFTNILLNIPILDLEEIDGKLYIGTTNGLYILDKDFTLSETDFNIPVTKIIKFKERIFLGTYGNGLYLISGDYQKIKGFNKYTISDIIIHDDMLVIACFETGLFTLVDNPNDKNIQKIINIPKGIQFLNDINPRCLASNNHKLYIGTYGQGIIEFKNDVIVEDFLFYGSRINSLLISDNELLIGTQGSGLNKHDIKTDFFTIQTPHYFISDFPEKEVFKFFRLDENHYLLSTWDNGPFNIIQENENLRSEIFHRLLRYELITSIRKIQDDIYIFCWNGNIFKNSHFVKRLESNIYTVQFQENTAIIGSDKCIYKYDFKKNEIVKKIEIDAKNIISLYLSDNSILAGTNGNGLFEINASNTKNIPFKSRIIKKIIEFNGELLFVTEKNILKNMKEQKEIFTGIIRDIFVKNGVLVVVTMNEIFYLDRDYKTVKKMRFPAEKIEFAIDAHTGEYTGMFCIEEIDSLNFLYEKR